MTDEISLKQYMETRIESLRREIDIALAAANLATSKSEQAIDYRLQHLNDFRNSLQDQTRGYATKAELEALREMHTAEIKGLQKIVYALTGGLVILQALLQFIPST